jgi:two-component system, chemotaxis family, response regulator Rcp1
MPNTTVLPLTNDRSCPPVEILLVEDNPGDVRLTREGLKDGKLVNNLNVIGDGLDALAFLRREPPFENAPRPDLILLDLDLPRMSGRELLERIKADREISVIPVVILTASRAEEDILRSYRLDAACFVTKPLDLDRFRSVVESIQDFWFAVVRVNRSA